MVIPKFEIYLRGVHRTKPSPEYPVGHLHCGLWFITRHNAPGPQASLHGLTQERSTHARSEPHSWSLKHSKTDGSRGTAKMSKSRILYSKWINIRRIWLKCQKKKVDYLLTCVTFYSWVTSVRWCTRATRCVINRFAECVLSTWVGSTSFNATSTTARLTIGTIRIHWAFGFRWSSTSVVWCHTTTVGTNTSDGAQRQHVYDLTVESGITWVFKTKIDTAWINAGKWCWAVSVIGTLCFVLCDIAATTVWVTSSACRAAAYGAMVPSSAYCVRCARLISASWLAHTIESVANLCLVTVFVVVADCRNASSSWISLGARRTAATSDVRNSHTICVSSAWCSKWARILAVIVDTHLIKWTAVVWCTFSCWEYETYIYKDVCLYLDSKTGLY